MTLDEFYKELDKEDTPVVDYIVTLELKYTPYDKPDITNELLLVNWDQPSHYIWQNDWDEGQEYVKVLGYISVEDVQTETAEWEESRYRSVDQTGETYDDGPAFVCSRCRCAFKAKLLWRDNFCPNCGRRMIKRREEEWQSRQSMS